jgi:hypothetical protein
MHSMTPRLLRCPDISMRLVRMTRVIEDTGLYRDPNSTWNLAASNS